MTAARTGTAEVAAPVPGRASRASKVVLGLYADAGGEPGALLGSATRRRARAGAWNTRALDAGVAARQRARRTGSRCSTRPTRPACWPGATAPAAAAGSSARSASETLTRAAGDLGDRRALQRRPGLRRRLGSARRAAAAGARRRARPRSHWPRPRAAPPVTAALAVTNAGDGTLTFTAADDAPWLTHRAGVGTAPATVTLTADPAGLAPGTYTATVIGRRGPTTDGRSRSTFRSPRPRQAWSARGASTRRPARPPPTPPATATPARSTARCARPRAASAAALDFDGVNDWVTVADSAVAAISRPGMTLEGWAYPTGGSGWRTLALKETARRPRLGAVPVRRRRAPERPRRDQRRPVGRAAPPRRR